MSHFFSSSPSKDDLLKVLPLLFSLSLLSPLSSSYHLSSYLKALLHYLSLTPLYQKPQDRGFSCPHIKVLPLHQASHIPKSIFLHNFLFLHEEVTAKAYPDTLLYYLYLLSWNALLKR